jgi:hypothetical protein
MGLHNHPHLLKSVDGRAVPAAGTADAIASAHDKAGHAAKAGAAVKLAVICGSLFFWIAVLRPVVPAAS